MTDTKAALTPEEWEEEPKFTTVVNCRVSDENPRHGFYFLENNPRERREKLEAVVAGLGDDRHALAAVALRDQLFGFTRGDIEVLKHARDALNMEQAWPMFEDDVYPPSGIPDIVYDSIIERIEALLPPEKK